MNDADEQPFTLRFDKTDQGHEGNIAEKAVQFASDWVYFARAGQYNGVEGASPFAATVTIGIYTAGLSPAATLDEADAVLLVGSACVNITTDPRVSERTRASLVERLRIVADDIEKYDLTPKEETR